MGRVNDSPGRVQEKWPVDNSAIPRRDEGSGEPCAVDRTSYNFGMHPLWYNPLWYNSIMRAITFAVELITIDDFIRFERHCFEIW